MLNAVCCKVDGRTKCRHWTDLHTGIFLVLLPTRAQQKAQLHIAVHCVNKYAVAFSLHYVLTLWLG